MGQAGSAVNAGGVRAGDTVVVVGIGGIGINAVQGARLAGAEHLVSVDPIPFKRDKATGFGATHTAATSEEAQALVSELTYGRGANVVINTMGLGTGEQIGKSLGLTAKRHSLSGTANQDMRKGRNLRGVITF